MCAKVEQYGPGMSEMREQSASRIRKKILVIDDDHDMRVNLRTVLEDEDYHVISATNGKDALKLLKPPELPSLILLDLMMPILGGLDFLELKQADPMLAFIPVVIISAHDPPHQITGISGFLKKPFGFDALLETVRKHC